LGVWGNSRDGQDWLLGLPASLLEDDEGKIVSFLPANYRISEDEYQNLIKGGQVEVTHNDGKWDGIQAIKGPDQKRTYGGPSHS
jgi:hypothetical protein